MELRNLKTFVKAAELSSFTKAAEQLGYAQSTVTLHIQQLEQELGVPLFERIGKKIRITEKGQELWSYAAEMLVAAEKALKIAQESGLVKGQLCIGVVESLQNDVLPEILHNYHRHYPQVKIVVKASDCGTLRRLLMQNKIDMMLGLDLRLEEEEFIKAYEGRAEMVFAAGAGHPLSGRISVTVEELLREPFLVTERHLSYGRELEYYLAKKGLNASHFLEIGNPGVIVELLKSGDGISYLPLYSVQKEVAKGGIVCLPAAIPEIQMWIQLIYHRNKWVTPQMQGFIREVRGVLTTQEE